MPGDDLLSSKEREYLSSHDLGHLATVDTSDSPHVVPVGYHLNDDGTIDIGGPHMGSSQKFRNVQRHSRVAFAVDDLTPQDEPEFRPGVGRGIVLRGRAQALHDQQPPALAPPDFFSREIIRIHPEHIVSWHIDPGRRGPSILRDRGGRL